MTEEFFEIIYINIDLPPQASSPILNFLESETLAIERSRNIEVVGVENYTYVVELPKKYQARPEDFTTALV